MATTPTTGNDTITGTNAGEAISALAGNDTVYAGGGDDAVHGGAGNDKLFGEAGNDRLWGDAGNDDLDGGAGTDAAYFSGNQAQYQVTTSGGVTEVKDLRGQGGTTPDGTDKVANVERLIFADGYRLLAPDLAPDAVNDGAATNEDTAVNIAVLGNDTDADGDTLSIAFLPDADADATKPGIQTALGATVSVVDGQVRYDPTGSDQLQKLDAGEKLTDSFTYTVSDGFGGTDSATVSVDVSGANDLARSFDGQTINFAIIVETAGYSGSGNTDLTVGDQVEYYDSGDPIDVSANSIRFGFNSNGDFFPGKVDYTFSDSHDVLNDFRQVSIAGSAGVSGFDQSDISFNANTISLNFAGVTFDAGGYIEFGVAFA